MSQRMNDKEQAQEVEVFLEVLKTRDIETQTLALEAIMTITNWLIAQKRITTFEHARDHARAIYWAIVQEKDLLERRKLQQ